MPIDLITMIPDHRAQAKRDVFSQFWDDPVCMALVESFGHAVQIFEEIAFDAIVSTALGNASGVDLKVWGSYVGERQGTLNAAEYRAIISGRILARASNGTFPEIMEVFKASAGGSEVWAWALHPASQAMTVWREDSMSDAHRARVRVLMQDPKLACMNLVLLESIVDASLVYDDGPGYDLGEHTELV